MLSFVGYSGHAYVCIETAKSMNLSIYGYYDKQKQENNPYKLLFLGNEELHDENKGQIFISIGDNKIRSIVYEKLKNKNCKFASLVHPNSIVSKTLKISENVLISAGAIINAQVTIKNGVIINSGAIIEHECEINHFAHIAPGATLAGNVKIGERTFIGANTSIKHGISICNDVTIGMGAVVTKNITEPGVYIGNPARKLIK